MNLSEIDWGAVMPSRAGEAWVRRDGDQTAIYDPRSGLLYRLNDPALAIWEICDGNTTPGEMAAALTELTGVDNETSLREVIETLESLLAQRLIVVES